jgi:hypothetical protein
VLADQVPAPVSAPALVSAAVASTRPDSVGEIVIESSESEVADDESVESGSVESNEEYARIRKAKIAKLKRSIKRQRQRARALREHIANRNVSLAEKATLVRGATKKKKEDELDRRSKEVKKTPGFDEEEPTTAAATADLMGDRLHNNAIWNRVPANYFNVHTEWCVVNSPKSDSLVLVRPTLYDAHVIDVAQYRNFVALAMEMVELIDNDEVNTVRPLRAQLIAELFKYNGSEELQAEEIEIIIEYDGVITYDADNVNILGAAIGFYTIPVPRDESERFRPPKKVDVGPEIQRMGDPENEANELKYHG